MSISIYSFSSFVMMLGSSHAATDSSSHKYSSSAHCPIYFAAGVPVLAICSIIALVIRVFTEMSTVVTVTFFHGARKTMCTASGSNQKLNSLRFAWAQLIGSIG